MKNAKLPRSFYLRPTLTVAKDLLGRFLIRRLGRSRLIGMIVEVEAYLGLRDAASHTFRGRTQRNEVMFREGGHLYVYFTYGMHYCANVVTEEEGIGHAVLIRAVEPVQGINHMRQNRKLSVNHVDDVSLTNGPAKFCQAFSISRADNGTDLLGDTIYLTEGLPVKNSCIQATTRIGIRSAVEKKWRFYIRENSFVSRLK